MDTTTPPTDVGFVYLNLTIEWFVVLGHEFLTDELSHTPRSLVGDA